MENRDVADELSDIYNLADAILGLSEYDEPIRVLTYALCEKIQVLVCDLTRQETGNCESCHETH